MRMLKLNYQDCHQSQAFTSTQNEINIIQKLTKFSRSLIMFLNFVICTKVYKARLRKVLLLLRDVNRMNE